MTPGGLGQRGRVVGQRRVDVRHLAQEDVPDLSAVTVNGRHEDVAGPVLPELHDQFGQVGFDRADADRGERFVHPDLLGNHRLDLDHLGSTCRRDKPGDDPVRLVRVASPVHRAAAGADLLL